MAEAGPASPVAPPKAALAGVKHVVLVLSGKGGVGKSTVAVQIATSLVAQGKKVGLLDVDLCVSSMHQLTQHTVWTPQPPPIPSRVCDFTADDHALCRDGRSFFCTQFTRSEIIEQQPKEKSWKCKEVAMHVHEATLACSPQLRLICLTHPPILQVWAIDSTDVGSNGRNRAPM